MNNYDYNKNSEDFQTSEFFLNLEIYNG
jgi:hypothetical protein